MTILTPDLAERFARVALGHVTREFPNKPGNTMAGPGDARTPAALYPVFHGSFDWHSCVHGYWLLAHLLRRCPALPATADIRALFGRQLTAANVQGEYATLSAPHMRGFERPYGWAWLLKLSDELRMAADRRWERALRPLVELIAGRLRDFLPLAAYPVRAGTHFNTAFALRLAADYAEGAGDAGLLSLLAETAERWYGADRACPAWGEPSGDDFLSPALVEAECMRRLLPPERFTPWFDAFLPDLAAGKPAVLFAPATVSDRSDGKTAHLDGLNLSRAWFFRALASALPQGDGRVPVMRDAAARHIAPALPHVSGDYMGEHWLATYAALALTA